jgi:hypothetical protein
MCTMMCTMMLLGVIIGLVLGAPLGLLLGRLAEANGEDAAASDVPAERAFSRMRPTTPMVIVDGRLGLLCRLGGTASAYTPDADRPRA